MEISRGTAHHQKLMAAGASSQMDEVVSCDSKPRQQSPAATETQATVERKPRPHPDKAINCPRCNSVNTKFCYYNNYSMSQPRYFCKECRRYWTQGGSLRNVPIGGGCRKNRRSSTSSSSSSAAASKINKQLVPEPMAPPSCTDFPNVLPTFISTGFAELPRDHLSMAFGSSSSNPAVATLDPGGTFLDILRGGLLDGNHGSNDFYGSTSGSGMVMPPSAFGVGAGMMMQHGLGDATADHALGGATATQGVVNGSMDAAEEDDGGTKAMMGLQWPSQLGGGFGSTGGKLQVGAQQQQQQQGTVNNINVMMDNNNNNHGSSRDYYWNNGAAGSGNPWQGLINSSSLI